jgi:hypothetical protein
VLDVGNALAVAAERLPIHDPREPNDNLAWVDGRLLPRSAPVWAGGKPIRFDALLDKQEDRVDVYRIVIPARRSAKVSVIPRLGDPALDVFASGTFSINDYDGRVARSRRAGSKRTERATVRNRDSVARSYYVTIRPQGNSRYQEREYTLRVG